MARGTAVHPEFQWPVDGVHRHIDPSVIVEVGKDGATVHAGHSKIGPCAGRNIPELSSNILKHTVGLRFIHIQAAAGNENVELADVIQVREPAPPSALAATQFQHTIAAPHVFETYLAVIST